MAAQEEGPVVTAVTQYAPPPGLCRQGDRGSEKVPRSYANGDSDSLPPACLLVSSVLGPCAQPGHGGSRFLAEETEARRGQSLRVLPIRAVWPEAEPSKLSSPPLHAKVLELGQPKQGGCARCADAFGPKGLNPCPGKQRRLQGKPLKSQISL